MNPTSDGGSKAPRAVVYIAEGQAAVLEAPASDFREGDDEFVTVRTQFSALSRGTERLVLAGKVPESERERMRAPFQRGEFPFPVTYGYAAVGVVEHGPSSLLGRAVFALHPHQDRFQVPASAVHPLPDGLPPRRAAMAANMETALNTVWDSGVGPGDKVAVIGAGAVGCLTASLLSRIAGCDVTLIDRYPGRALIASKLGVTFVSEAPANLEADVVFHASASAAGLASALACAGREAVVVEMSWYGEGDVPAPLGGAFHSRRLTLRSSQVGAIPPSRAPRWDYSRRLRKSLYLLGDSRLDILLTDEISFDETPARIPELLSPEHPAIVPLIRY